MILMHICVKILPLWLTCGMSYNNARIVLWFIAFYIWMLISTYSDIYSLYPDLTNWVWLTHYDTLYFFLALRCPSCISSRITGPSIFSMVTLLKYVLWACICKCSTYCTTLAICCSYIWSYLLWSKAWAHLCSCICGLISVVWLHMWPI